MNEIRVLRHNYLNIYVNSFVLTGETGSVFIDSGLNGNAHVFTPYLQGEMALVATHGHWDHIGLHSISSARALPYTPMREIKNIWKTMLGIGRICSGSTVRILICRPHGRPSFRTA